MQDRNISNHNQPATSAYIIGPSARRSDLPRMISEIDGLIEAAKDALAELEAEDRVMWECERDFCPSTRQCIQRLRSSLRACGVPA